MVAKRQNTRKMDLLKAVEQIIELSKGSHLEKEFFAKAAKPLKYVADKMELTKEQSLMLALFIDNSSNSRITVSDFATFLECSTTRILRLLNEIDELERRGLVCRSSSRAGTTYRIPMEVIDAFRKDEKYKPQDKSGLNCYQLFGELQALFEMRDENELTYEQTKQKINLLFDDNMHLNYVQKMRGFRLEEDDEVLLVLFSHLFVNNHDDHICFHDLEFLYDRKSEWNCVRSELNDNVHVLQESKMIEFNSVDGLVNSESMRMTMMAKKELFPELKLASLNQDNTRNNLLKHEKIVAKQLFYDQEASTQVENLTRLLEEKHYKAVCERLKEKGYRSGFTCLFYGAPGTGKTETVLQLARQTGRDIFQVNIPEIKSAWVGESEKNIKQVFDQYREKVNVLSVTPILLFNEADAILGIRQEGAERAVDKMENAIQNIILQEMESLNGIMIATTNLAQNMDKAFERRFLYKVKFNKPSLEARMSIWHTMLPTLSDTEIRALASKYDFSGGQIENIARHYTIDGILNGESSVSLETLMGHCDNERLEQKEGRKIGF